MLDYQLVTVVKSCQKDCKRGYYFMGPRYAKNMKEGFRGCLIEM